MRGFKPLSGNHLELLNNADVFFEHLVNDINNAEETVHLGFYIWQEGGRVQQVIAALICAAQRGVECRALADAFGSKSFLHSSSLKQLKAAGVEFTKAMPTGAIRTKFARADLRNHRKIAVIDQRIAYTGSQNLVDPTIFKQGAGVGEWVDAMVRIKGPAAICLGGVFELDWSIEKNTPFQSPILCIEHSDDAVVDAEHASLSADLSPQSTVQVLPSGPDLQPETIHQVLLSAIYGARKELILTTPYFVPDESILTALISAANSGIKVTLIVPAHNDSFMVRYASLAHFDDLMAAGVRIALFNDGLLHTKSLSVDGQISIFGSVNIDMRSLWLNFEISLIIYDEGFTQRLCNLQSDYLKKASWIDLDRWRKRPVYRRFLSNTCRLLSPLL